jgi:signal transduction histidine kinase
MKFIELRKQISAYKGKIDFGLIVLLSLILLSFIYEIHRESQLNGRSNLKNGWEYLDSSIQANIPSDTLTLNWKPSKDHCINESLQNTTLWLRTTLPSNLPPSHIIIRSYPAPFEVFIENQRIYQFPLPTEISNRIFNGFASHRIPITPANSDKPIFFRLNSRNASKPGFCGPASFQLEENKFAIVNSHQDGFESSFVAFLGILFGCLGFGMVFISPITQRRFYVSFAGLMFSLSSWIYGCVSGPLVKWPYHWTPMIWSYFDLMGLYLTPTFLIMFYCEVFKKHSSEKTNRRLINILVWMYRFYFLHAGIVLTLSLFGIIYINSFIQIFDISAILFLIIMNTNIIGIIVRNKLSLKAWITPARYSEIAKIKYFSAGFFTFTVTGVHDVLVGIQSSSTSDDKHWTYIGAFAIIASLFLLLVKELIKTISDTKHHKAIENTLDRELHDIKTPVTRTVQVISSLYTLLPRAYASFDELLNFRNICVERLQASYNIAVRAERNISDTIKNRKYLQTYEAPSFSSVSLTELIHEQIQQSLSGYKFSRIEFKYDYQHKRQLWCDAKQISRVLGNLLSNAAKYAKGSPPVITFKTVEVSDSVVISIINTGDPVPLSECDNIFEKFYTIDQNAKESKDGHGIGLTIVKTFAEANSGSIRCNPIKNYGTEFVLSLKTTNALDKADTSYLIGSSNEIPQVASIILGQDSPFSREEEQLQIKIISLLSTRSNPFKICIMDDEYIIRQSIISYISASKLSDFVSVEAIEDHIEGITQVIDHSHDLVLIDLVFGMEREAGFFVLKKLRNCTYPYKVIYTNNTVLNEQVKAHNANETIDKPMLRPDFFKLIIRTIEHQNQRGDLFVT